MGASPSRRPLRAEDAVATNRRPRGRTNAHPDLLLLAVCVALWLRRVPEGHTRLLLAGPTPIESWTAAESRSWKPSDQAFPRDVGGAYRSREVRHV